MAKIGDTVTWTDDYEGRLTGKVIDVWPEQDILVVEILGKGKDLDANYFVPFAKAETVG